MDGPLRAILVRDQKEGWRNGVTPHSESTIILILDCPAFRTVKNKCRLSQKKKSHLHLGEHKENYSFILPGLLRVFGEINLFALQSNCKTFMKQWTFYKNSESIGCSRHVHWTGVDFPEDLIACEKISVSLVKRAYPWNKWPLNLIKVLLLGCKCEILCKVRTNGRDSSV